MYGGDVRRTITGALKAGALQPSSRSDALPEPKPLHRLDAAVGGVLLIAKTSSAAADISRQFVERRVHKVYHALLCGQLLPGAALSTATAPAPFQQQNQTEHELPQHAEGSQPVSGSGVSPLDAESRIDASSGDTSSAVASGDEEESGQSDLDGPPEGETAQLLPLEELLQRQLLGSPSFTVTMQDLADPVLQSVADSIPAGCSSSSSGDSSSSSSSSSGHTGGLGIGAGVHLVDLPVEGRPSYSLYKVLGYSRSSRYGGWVTSVALSPVTGRKHQLRRHMAALGCPIVGDGK
jgi:hypothetical protein